MNTSFYPCGLAVIPLNSTLQLEQYVDICVMDIKPWFQIETKTIIWMQACFCTCNRSHSSPIFSLDVQIKQRNPHPHPQIVFVVSHVCLDLLLLFMCSRGGCTMSGSLRTT